MTWLNPNTFMDARCPHLWRPTWRGNMTLLSWGRKWTELSESLHKIRKNGWKTQANNHHEGTWKEEVKGVTESERGNSPSSSKNWFWHDGKRQRGREREQDTLKKWPNSYREEEMGSNFVEQELWGSPGRSKFEIGRKPDISKEHIESPVDIKQMSRVVLLHAKQDQYGDLLQTCLRCGSEKVDVAFKSETNRKAMEIVLLKERKTIILDRTGGGNSAEVFGPTAVEEGYPSLWSR